MVMEQAPLEGADVEAAVADREAAEWVVPMPPVRAAIAYARNVGLAHPTPQGSRVTR